MYEEVKVECEDCKGQGIVKGQTDEGPYSRTCWFRCIECEGEGFVIKLIEEPDEE